MGTIRELIERWLWGKHSDKKRYPKNQKVKPVYKSERIYEKGEDRLPTKTVTAYIYTLSCPICGHAVKRENSYCSECGNELEFEYEWE